MLKKKLNKKEVINMNEKRSTIKLLNDLKIFRNYKEDCLTYFNDTKEAQRFDKYIAEVETELTRRGVEF